MSEGWLRLQACQVKVAVIDSLSNDGIELNNFLFGDGFVAAAKLVANELEKSLKGLKALCSHPFVSTDYSSLYRYFLSLR